MVTLDSHLTTSITVTKKVFSDFLLYEIVGTDKHGRKTKVQFFSHDLDLDMDDLLVEINEEE